MVNATCIVAYSTDSFIPWPVAIKRLEAKHKRSSEIWHKVFQQSPRAPCTSYPVHRVGVAMQRGNAAAVHAG